MGEAILGKLCDETAQRDAIHVAIAPVTSDELLYPGQHVGLVGADKVSSTAGTLHGIVDPFVLGPIYPGRRFYLCLYPQTVTGMRHHWQHPAFEGNEKETSQAWIAELAESLGLSYRSLMEAAELWVSTGEYTTQQGSEDWRDGFWGNEKNFWKHYEIVTGTKVEDHDATFFSCSC